MTITLTQEEIAFIVNVVNQIHVKPTQPDAIAVVQVVQSLLGKLSVLPTDETSS